MSSVLSAQHWDTSHPNVPTRKVTKQSSLEDKEAYLKIDVLLARKKGTILLTIQRRSIKASLPKPDGPVWQTE
jgi:hypothetical protein